ncbi:hypothetical protein TEA_021936 [Camellia sinensis var. sinensis]|uniref:Glutamyl-tRNA(Gln) amidotransferase subunit C, chloroplastic/mitochondrial n=1 Tax=Camellia sinensis var. sinensis TaxID=542762 RepID=A0A4S4DBW8_CAMSN|nr:hypothetical protein TEA_021936 [Camellia sinensis var. sinensis]
MGCCELLLLQTTINMGSRALLLLRPTTSTKDLYFKGRFLSEALIPEKRRIRSYSVRSTIHPPDLPRLAETARISLTPDEVEEFAPKIQQVVDWFGQLQAVDLQSIQPAIGAGNHVFYVSLQWFAHKLVLGVSFKCSVAKWIVFDWMLLKFSTASVDTEGENLRDDMPETFENRDAMIAAVPSYEEPFIKVPKVLNKE